ncbi:MAG: hypothetical protein A3Q59_03590 [Methanomethylophilus alvi]|nr:MAG: hypothetical protein A3Q59_03590 [Methanomethylophilus alvi]
MRMIDYEPAPLPDSTRNVIEPNYATGEIRIDHELDNGDARNACAVMPGKVVRVECGPGNTDGSYSATDHYEVAFCRNTGSGLFGMSEECQLFSEDIRVLIR